MCGFILGGLFVLYIIMAAIYNVYGTGGLLVAAFIAFVLVIFND